ncbi:hypothetical protein GIB67_029642 [Kingdonia uniflora]|uniref:Uncharacterized protein n=1 Tax=Kingdonia uniflora TaxID=39325 RepID=A0A7J7LLI5_9MAGN|nr:hypothetical protein GIB67_029642 [Kingdonia uniflora]
MLQRAASSAYSSWWASHIRTKQSKWLEENLHEESYRAYRALAERYDHISGDLQNANHTIAKVYPEQVQVTMEQEEEEDSLKMPAHSLEPIKIPKANIPQVPKFPKKVSKKTNTMTTTSSSKTSKAETLEAIDKLQKGILAIQTEREFVKISYECRLEKRNKRYQSKKQELSTNVWRLPTRKLGALNLKDECLLNQNDNGDLSKKETMDEVQAELISDKIREHLKIDTDVTSTVTELIEKIDEFVTKTINLESAVSSQAALIKKLRTENDELQEHLRTLEEDKVTPLKDINLSAKLRELEEKLHGIQKHNKNVGDQNHVIQTHFTKAHCNLNHLSENLKCVKHLYEETESTDNQEAREQTLLGDPTDGAEIFDGLLSSIPLIQETHILETMVQIRELESSNNMKDEEIKSLRQELNFLQSKCHRNTHLTKLEVQSSEATTRLDEAATVAAITEEEKFKVILTNESQGILKMEEKFRRSIDELLEENLEFWLRFSTSFHQIQKFQMAIDDLQTEFLKMKKNEKQE